MQAAPSIVSRADAVIVVVDVQDRLASVMADRDRVVARSELVLSAASITGCPIIVTRQYPKGLGDIVDTLGAHIETLIAEGTAVHVADKVTFDCFCEPDFASIVERLGRRQLVIVGMETHICVTQTALAGAARGFGVHVASDGCCSRDSFDHRTALDRMRHAGVVVTTAESVAYELVGAAGTPEFKRLLAAVKS